MILEDYKKILDIIGNNILEEDCFAWKHQQAQGGDFILNPKAKRITPLVPACVLVGIIEYEDPCILFTKRAKHLRWHAGQASFPGGKVDVEDATPHTTVLREAYEEIGLEEEFVNCTGFLDSYESVTGFLVLPILAFIRPGFTLRINSSEVAECFEVPLRFLMAQDNYHLDKKNFGSSIREYWSLHYNNQHIWGVTAAILYHMSKKVSSCYE